MKRSILISLMCLVIALTGIMPAFAASPESGSTLETQVKYEAIKTDWLWSVPATQTFTDGSLTKTGDVSITPANSGDVIILDEGTQIDISLNSANTFKLTNTDKSAIPYEVKKGSAVLVNNDNVLHFEAGVSTNTGVTQTLSFETTAAKIKEAKLTGQHTDIVTFNLGVTGNIFTINSSTNANGTVTVNKSVRQGESLTITVNPNTDCVLQSLNITHNGSTEDVSSSVANNQYVITNVQSNIVIEAVFGYASKMIAFTIDGNGTVNGHNSSFSEFVEYDGDKTITVKPNNDYHLTTFTINGIDQKGNMTKVNDYEYTYELTNIQENKTVNVVFEVHNYVLKSSTATCNEAGVNTYECTCGVTKDETISATGHAYDNGIVTTEATCTVDGVKTITCTKCGESYTEPIPAGHKYGEDNICTVCGAVKIIAATFNDGTELSWEELKLAANGTKYGYRADLITDDALLYDEENGKGAFRGCTSLTSITIPNSVTSIGDNAFQSCSSLTSITIPDSVTSIGVFSFCHCTSLPSITIPSSVTSIGKYAFDDCTNLTSITITEGVTSIGSCAFRDCASLTSITIPKSVISIGDYAFSKCTSLDSVTIGNGVTSMEKSVFQYCESLTSITIPKSVTWIKIYAFRYCTSLTNITYTGTQAQWNSIEFDVYWNQNTGNYTIHCTNGDIAKS